MTAINIGPVACQKRSPVTSECLGSAKVIDEMKDFMENEPHDPD